MIIITGAAGFIGSIFAKTLNERGYQDIVLVDDFSKKKKEQNWQSLSYSEKVERDVFFTWIQGKETLVQAIVHLGARTDTTEQDWEVFENLNLNYSKKLWAIAVEQQIPFIYASSAATYGDGSQGFEDDESKLGQLASLNPYGRSKHEFDVWVLSQKRKPFFWAGLKFFNVFGPNEYHKGRMASVVFHAFRQIAQTGEMKLFRSHRPDYADGMQLRDFVYVKDLASVMVWLLEERKRSGIFNLGTGKARSFLDLVYAVFSAMNMEPIVKFIDIPEDIRNAYQYFTEAKMDKLKRAGYHKEFTSLEDAVRDYVQNHLSLDINPEN
jgi:ADP-L-glycero-D-manno-heptose 6-epimerase